jgi:hypothetical protein
MMIVLAKIALGIAGLGVAGVSVLCSEGVVNVKVVEKQPHGFHMHVIAPAMLAPIAVRLAPQSALADAAREIRPHMPEIQAALNELRDSDDFVLVEVKSPEEHVEVQKAGRSIVVDVDDADDFVHVSAPIGAVASTIDQLAAGGEDSRWR